MIKMIRTLFISALFVTLCMSNAFADASFLSSLDGKGFPKLKKPHVVEKTLSNGMKCYLKEDHTLPVVRLKVLIKGGGIYNAKDKVGLASLVGMTMRSGGAGKLVPEDFDSAVDDIGASIYSGIGREKGEASLMVLSEDLDTGLALFFEMLFEPKFVEKRIEVARQNIIEALRRERDEPGDYADRLFAQMVYGKDSVWARIPNEKDLKKIQRKDLVDFHKRYFRTDNMILAASGDFDSKEFLRLLEAFTDKSPSGKVTYPQIAKIEPKFIPEAEDVKGPSNQAFVRMGHLGVKRHNPDWFALYVFNHIFGMGSFKSRLMEDIRTKRGLAYSIRGGFSQGTDYGLFEVEFSTSSKTAGLAIDLVKQHIVELAKTGEVTKGELDFSKRSIMAGAIFDMDSAYKIVSDRARFDFYDYPPDYWIVAYDGISNVTRSDVSRVAKKYLHPDGLKILNLGPK